MSVSLGPLALPLDALLLFITFLVFTASTSIFARRMPRDKSADWPAITGNGVSISVISALLVARIAFVIKFWQQYSASPFQIINIRDGGFTAPAGWFALIVILLFYSYRYKPLLRVYVSSAAMALTIMVPANIAMTLYKQGQSIPQASVSTLEGDSVQLHHFKGKPLVVNYWASWCPPCRREMPVLEAAQQANADLHFVFVNQGETVSTVTTYLRRNNLALDNVLLDRTRALSQASGAAGLPTTLFFDATGQLSDMHMGEVSAAGLRRYLDKISIPNASVKRSN